MRVDHAGLEGLRRGALLFSGAPGEIRTPDQLVRSQVLYPAELRARIGDAGLRQYILIF